ncbi:MAG TPA: hypothetical protein V6C72_15515 [Chroococcales cyanobacterium]
MWEQFPALFIHGNHKERPSKLNKGLKMDTGRQLPNDADLENLLNLCVTFWLEAVDEHSAPRPSDCPGCWKAFMSNKLWSRVTGQETPVMYHQDHLRALSEAGAEMTPHLSPVWLRTEARAAA